MSMPMQDSPDGDNQGERPYSETQRVVVYFMHEEEEERVLEIIDPARRQNGRRPLERTSGFVMSDATEAEIRMFEQGLLVERPPSPVVGRGLPGEVSAAFTTEESDSEHRFILQLDGPLFPDRAELLERLNVRLVEALPNHSYRVLLRPRDEEISMPSLL